MLLRVNRWMEAQTAAASRIPCMPSKLGSGSKVANSWHMQKWIKVNNTSITQCTYTPQAYVARPLIPARLSGWLADVPPSQAECTRFDPRLGVKVQCKASDALKCAVLQERH